MLDSWSSLAAAALADGLVLAFILSMNDKTGPPRLSNGGVPFFGNAYQFVMDGSAFQKRARAALRKSPIVRFKLLWTPVYLISGKENVATAFRNSARLNSNAFVVMIMQDQGGIDPHDAQRFLADRSGRLPKSQADSNWQPGQDRLWAGLQTLFSENLMRPSAVVSLTATFARFFEEEFKGRFPVGEWQTVHLLSYLKTGLADAAVRALAGEKLLEWHPGYTRHIWALDELALQLHWDIMPEWMNPRPFKVRRELLGMTLDYLRRCEAEYAQADYSAQDPDWEPIWGSRLVREKARWGKRCGLKDVTRASQLIILFGAMNVNTIPVTAWTIIELAKDSELFAAVREEVSTCITIDPSTKKRRIDTKALLELPLLLSLYIEIMRLHVAGNITREMVADGVEIAGHHVEKGALVIAPYSAAHLDEETWAVEGHPASEFYAARHIQYQSVTDEKTGETKKKAEFVLRAGPAEFFPYGGGVSICAGRVFSKQKIMLAVAMMVARFDMEMVEWTTLDAKSKSDRPALDNGKHSGTAGMPPDRDLKMRWKRLW